jgi:hypothetical protein
MKKIMEKTTLENIKTLITENINDAASFTDLQGHLDIIQRTLDEMKKPGYKKI